MSFKLKQAAICELERYNMDELFPNVEAELRRIIEMKDELKQGIVNFLIRDAAGHQFNAIRLCSVPEPYDEFEAELEDIESELEMLEKDDPRYTTLFKEAKKLERTIKKLKDPHKYLDDICESFRNCPLFKSGDAPQGCLCPFEYKLVSDWTEGYLKEFDIHIAVQGVDKSIISQLVVSDLIIYRCMKAIASTSLVDISEKPTEFGISYEKKINSYLEIKEKESKNKLKLLNNMIATRADKRKFKVEDKKSNQLKNAEDNMSKFIKEKESIRKTGMKTLIPSIPPYYYEKPDGEIILSSQAYIDAKDFLLNEFGFNKGNIVDEFDYNGNLNTEKMYFSNDYSISANGNIYHKDDIVFNINDKNKIFVEYIDFNNHLIKFKPGVFVSLDKIAPIDKIKDFFEYNDSTNNNRGIIEFSTDKDKLMTIIPENATEDERVAYEEQIKNFEGVTLEDLINIFGEDPTESLRKVITSNKNFPEGFQFCNTSHVNYLWLMFLLIIGGGSACRAPLPQDGSVCGYYEKPQRKSFGFVGSPASGNCSDKKYRTGHNRGYSSGNPQGIKVSLIQMLHSFLSPLFDINMNSLNFEFSVSKWKVNLNLMPSLCIGGTLEHGICKLQEWISEEIREMIGCNSQYIIPKIQDTGEGLVLDGIEELKSDSKNANDVEIFYNRNFAILWNYTHYHTKYNGYSEDDRKNEIVALYSTLNISSKRKMNRDDIERLFEKSYHVIYSDILLDADTGKASNDFENSYRLKLQPSSLTKMFASDTYKNVDVNADPSNVNKIITMGLHASYNCDLIDELDLFEADYSDSEFKPIFTL